MFFVGRRIIVETSFIFLPNKLLTTKSYQIKVLLFQTFIAAN